MKVRWKEFTRAIQSLVTERNLITSVCRYDRVVEIRLLICSVYGLRVLVRSEEARGQSCFRPSVERFAARGTCVRVYPSTNRNRQSGELSAPNKHQQSRCPDPLIFFFCLPLLNGEFCWIGKRARGSES